MKSYTVESTNEGLLYKGDFIAKNFQSGRKVRFKDDELYIPLNKLDQWEIRSIKSKWGVFKILAAILHWFTFSILVGLCILVILGGVVSFIIHIYPVWLMESYVPFVVFSLFGGGILYLIANIKEEKDGK